VELSPSFVAEHWPLTVASVAPLRLGRFDRGVFAVEAREGVFAAKVNDSPPPANLATRELDVFPYLSARRFQHAPELVRTRTGTPLIHTGARSVVVMELVPEPFDPDAPLTTSTWTELGQVMARLNRFTDYPHTGPTSFLDQVPDELRAKVRGHPIESEFLPLLDRVVALRESTQRGLVHAEVNAANSGRRADGTVVLLDWDGAGTGATALDYGYPLITQFIDQFDRTLDQGAAEAFYGSYAHAGGTVDAEEGFLAGLFQAMFLMWFFNVDGRWARIRWAVDHEDELCSMIERATRR
jgi:Ser/Thr protein kinase RdoA (MazF antagonist)